MSKVREKIKKMALQKKLVVEKVSTANDLIGLLTKDNELYIFNYHDFRLPTLIDLPEKILDFQLGKYCYSWVNLANFTINSLFPQNKERNY